MTDARSRFYAWRASHPREAEDPMSVWAAAWKLGGAEALVKSAQLAELVPRLEDLVHLFRALHVEHVHEAGRAWGESNVLAEEHAIEELPF